ncbi:MAG: hypothetical protein RBR05_05950, partial [Candidatus Methanomethylophilaceae archaeon]|nr:hypothetical protein [Candidatus Methanomethylophilaceae archaeon]
MRFMKRIAASLLILAFILSAGCLIPPENDTHPEENLETLILPASVMNGKIQETQTTASFPASSVLVPY